MSNQINKTVMCRALLGGLLLTLCLCNCTAAKAAYNGADSSCGRSVVVRDYLAPLEGLPKQKSFPSSGRLGFGPGILRVYPPRSRLIVSGRDRFESSGSLSRRSDSARQLGWEVESRLDRLNAQGIPSKLVRDREQGIGTVAGFAHRQFGFGGNLAPGIYRLQVSFSRERAMLGTFGEYFRVVPARSSLRLVAPRDEVQAGATIALRIENLGTVSATYNAYPHLYSPEGSEVPIDSGVGGALKPLLPAGVLSPCIDLPLPASLAAGNYLVTLDVKDRTMKHAKSISAPLYIAS